VVKVLLKNKMLVSYFNNNYFEENILEKERKFDPQK